MPTYEGAAGEGNARTFGVHGYALTATKPLSHHPGAVVTIAVGTRTQ